MVSSPPPSARHPGANKMKSAAEEVFDVPAARDGTKSTGPCIETGANSDPNSDVNRQNNNKSIVVTGGSIASPRNAKDPPVPAADPGSAIGANIDLMSRVALFADVGGGLFELCAALGPVSACRIRRDYLLKNDRYLVSCLEKLKRALGLDEANALRHDHDERDRDDVSTLFRFSGELDKCRDNIKAWMAVNTNWRTLCTEAELDECGCYKRLTIGNANVIFNNPALAIELGLVEVVQHQLNLMNVNVVNGMWLGIARSPISPPQIIPELADLALGRAAQGDMAILNLFLSAESFRTARDFPALGHLLHQAFTWNFCGIECFKSLLSHANVDLGEPETCYGSRPLLSISIVHLSESCRGNGNDDDIILLKKKVLALLQAGANPYELSPSGRTSLDLAMMAIVSLSGTSAVGKVWGEIVQKMLEYA